MLDTNKQSSKTLYVIIDPFLKGCYEIYIFQGDTNDNENVIARFVLKEVKELDETIQRDCFAIARNPPFIVSLSILYKLYSIDIQHLHADYILYHLPPSSFYRFYKPGNPDIYHSYIP